MTLGELNYSRSPLCWLAWAVLHTLLKRSSREGTPDLNLLFQYNMPDHAAGHLGQRTDRHVVLEQQVQVRRALAALDAERGGPAV